MAEQQITYIVAGSVVAMMVFSFLIYNYIVKKKITPVQILEAQQMVNSWKMLKYGTDHEKFFADFNEFETMMLVKGTFNTIYSTHLKPKTLIQYLSPTNKLTSPELPDIVERVAMFFEKAIIVEGSKAHARMAA